MKNICWLKDGVKYLKTDKPKYITRTAEIRSGENTLLSPDSTIFPIEARQ